MDPVFDAQYVPVSNRAFEEDTQIEVAYSADGWVDYVYVRDQLLARRDDTDQLQGDTARAAARRARRAPRSWPPATARWPRGAVY